MKISDLPPPQATFADLDHVNPLPSIRLYVDDDRMNYTGGLVLLHDGAVYVEQPVSEGVLQIAAERRRQVEQEGWTAEHDEEHDEAELAWAAVCYAAPVRIYGDIASENPPNVHYTPWPWEPEADKRTHGPGQTREQRIRDLSKAGALIAAEIDRLQALQ